MATTLTEELREVKNREHQQIPKDACDTICAYNESLTFTKVPKEGQQVPDGELLDIEGKPIRISECLKKGPLVLFFFSGSWCQLATTEFKHLQKRYNEIKQQGACLVGISNQTKDFSQRLKKDLGLTFDLLLDPNAQFANQFGVGFDIPDNVFNAFKRAYPDFEKSFGNGVHKLLLNSTFIVDAKGKICKVSVSNDLTKRIEPSQIVEVLKTCAKTESG